MVNIYTIACDVRVHCFNNKCVMKITYPEILSRDMYNIYCSILNGKVPLSHKRCICFSNVKTDCLLPT